MITKAEVLKAIARSEYLASNPLDRSSVQVERGDLTVLIEAAKTAQYRNIARPYEAKEFVLDDGTGAIKESRG